MNKIMDYEKKYNEAFERAKEKYAMFEGMKQGDVLEDVFPELKESKESDDEKKFSDILAILRGGENCYYNSPTLIDWLKSLKYRYTWKPSDGQIEALGFAVERIVPVELCIRRKVLKELLEQLKKLKG